MHAVHADGVDGFGNRNPTPTNDELSDADHGGSLVAGPDRVLPALARDVAGRVWVGAGRLGVTVGTA